VFISPMWSSESQRIGKQRCTPTGYMLHGISDLIGFMATVSLLCVVIYVVYSGVTGEFRLSMLWLFCVSFAIAIGGNMLHSYSWYLADKRRFEYDYEKDISTWVDESGVQQSYKYRSSGDETV
jgi:hypothetical protein